MKGFSDESKSQVTNSRSTQFWWHSWDQGQAFLALSSLYRMDEQDDPQQPGKLYQMCFHENCYH